MLPTINLGPLVISSASLVYIVGIWLSLLAVEKAASLLNLNVPWTYNLATLGLVSGFVAARLAFVAMYWDAYRDNLLGIIWPLTGGFNVWAGLLAGCFAAFFYGRARNLETGPTLDALAPGLLVGFMTISLADFLGGPGYGVETDAPWAISLFGVPRHPVQIYELAVGLLAIGAWLAYRKKTEFGGQLFLIATAVFSAGRLIVDAYRANAFLTQGGYHVVQIIALVVLLGAMALLMRFTTAQGQAQEFLPTQGETGTMQAEENLGGHDRYV